MKKLFNLKLISLLLIAIMLITSLVSCVPSEVPGADSSTTTATTTEAPPTYVDILKDGKTEYKIIRAEQASTAVINAVVQFNSVVGKTVSGTGRFSISDDFIGRNQEMPTSAKEIVVGVTNRPENAEFDKLLAEKDYGIFYRNERIYIYAKTDETVTAALDYFTSKYYADGTITLADNTSDIVRYTYKFSSVKLNGEDIVNYKIVIPSDADLLTKYAAENLVSTLATVCGRRLPIIKDSEAESECELLIGKTNRAASKAAEAVSCDAGSYILYRKGKQYVMTGPGYMVGGGAAALVTRHMTGSGDINVTDVSENISPTPFVFDSKANNAIIMIGDGMGNNHIEATLKAANTIDRFSARDLPNQGWATTYSKNYPTVTDSAASATAISSGYKTINGYLGLNQAQKSMPNVREVAHDAGAKTAVITTDVITGATPGGFLVHCNNRNNTTEIQKQIDKLISEGKVTYCEGSVDDNLTEVSANTLYGMADGESSFFAMIEAAYIDKRAHSNDLTNVIKMVVRYNDVVSYVMEFVLFHPDTALIVTADHETGGITLNETTGRYYFTSSNHTNANVPIFAAGAGTEIFNGKTVQNTRIGKFVASVFGQTSFGE